MLLKIKQPLPIHWRRLLIAIVILFISAFTLVAISNYRKAQTNQLDSITFSANIKADSCSANGRKACFFNGRIYYLSSESGTQGIYSMNSSGSDIKLEVPVEDIRAITVNNDYIYYSGFSGNQENICGRYRQFRLFSLKSGDTQPVDFLKAAQYSDSLQDENVWNFFVTNDNMLLIDLVNIDGYPAHVSHIIVSFKDSTAVQLSEYQVVEASDQVESTSYNSRPIYLMNLDGVLFVSGSSAFENQSTNDTLSYSRSAYYLNPNGNQIVFPIERAESSFDAFYVDTFSRWFCRVEGSNIIFSSVRGLESYNRETKITSKITTFDLPECVYNLIDCGDSFLVFTEELRAGYKQNRFATKVMKLNRALSVSLYRVNADTGEKTLLLTLPRNHSFLSADGQTVATGGGKTISIYDISGDSAVLLRTIQVEHNIVDRANKVDSAGGWLFLYRFNEETQRDELIEKVYIRS